MDTSIQIGGRIENDRCLGGTIALTFEIAAISVLNTESRCNRAHQSLKMKTSSDSEFFTDEEIRDKLELLDREYLKGRAALIKMLSVHRAHRGIHQNRKEMERRSRILAEAEDRFL